jgi:hypothetical protein
MASSPVSVLWAVPVRACMPRRVVSCHLGCEREASSGTPGAVAALLGGSLLAQSQRDAVILQPMILTPMQGHAKAQLVTSVQIITITRSISA